MTPIIPRPASEQARSFGERPLGTSAPGGTDHDDAISNRHPQSRAIGRWGEECAFYALERALSTTLAHARKRRGEGRIQFMLGERMLAEIHWLNWQEDRGVGYDIALREQDQESYIEVKATGDSAKASFEITAAEWECARRGGRHYRIFRLYNAGGVDARIDVLVDPYTLWREGKLMARPVRVEL